MLSVLFEGGQPHLSLSLSLLRPLLCPLAVTNPPHSQTLNRKLSTSTSTTQPPEPPMSTLQVLRSPGVGLVLYILAHTMTLALGYTAVMPVVMYEPVEKSGFGFSPAYISYSLATVGAAQALWILLVFPPLQKRVGSRRVLLWCAILWPFFMAAYPILNEFLRAGWQTAFWIVTPIMLVLGSGVSMAFGAYNTFLPTTRTRKKKQALTRTTIITINTSSCRPTPHQRHLPPSRSPRDCKCPIINRQLGCSSRSSRPLHIHLRDRNQARVGRWAFGMVCDCTYCCIALSCSKFSAAGRDAR